MSWSINTDIYNKSSLFNVLFTKFMHHGNGVKLTEIMRLFKSARSNKSYKSNHFAAQNNQTNVYFENFSADSSLIGAQTDTRV